MEKKMFSMRSILPLAVQGKGKGKGNGKRSTQPTKATPKRKEKIPVKLREEVWVAKMGRVFEGKCPTTWCTTTITVFDFESGHNIPESKGGATTIINLVPLCPRCNRSMGSQYTFDEWCNRHSDSQTNSPLDVGPPSSRPWWKQFLLCQ